MRRLLAAAATLSMMALTPACAEPDCGAMVDAAIACQFSGITGANRASLESTCENGNDSTGTIDCLTAAYQNSCGSSQELSAAIGACN